MLSRRGKSNGYPGSVTGYLVPYESITTPFYLPKSLLMDSDGGDWIWTIIFWCLVGLLIYWLTGEAVTFES